MSSFLEKLPDAKVLDLGGGLGIVEQAGQPALDVAQVGSLLQKFKEAHPNIHLWLEPGRFIIAESGDPPSSYQFQERKWRVWVSYSN